MRTLIKNGTVITMDESRKKQYEKLDIVFDDNIITCITKKYTGKYDNVIDASNKIVMPGLINAHAHLGMSIFRTTNDDMDLDTWLNDKIWPIEDQFTDEEVYYTTLLSNIEMIKTGTTTSNDMYFHKDGIIKALKETKVRSVFGLTLAGDIDKEKLKDFEEFYLKNKNNNLIKFVVAPHSMYTCTKGLLKEGKKFADKYNLPLHMHFCENEKEVRDIIEIYNETPMEALKELGYLDNKLILAHCTFVSSEELKLLKNKDVSFVHNPVSNLNLGCGIADIKKYMENDINVCLGTDGQGSGNNMNLFYHMSFVDFLQKGVYKNPRVFKSYDTLKMATIYGAKALGLENEIGSIEKGKKADLIILDINNIENYPNYDLINNIVHNVCPNNIDTTIIDGEVLMRNHKLEIDIDENELKNDIDRILKRVINKNT